MEVSKKMRMNRFVLLLLLMAGVAVAKIIYAHRRYFFNGPSYLMN